MRGEESPLTRSDTLSVAPRAEFLGLQGRLSDPGAVLPPASLCERNSSRGGGHVYSMEARGLTLSPQLVARCASVVHQVGRPADRRTRGAERFRKNGARPYCESHPDAEYVCATEPAVLRRSSETKALFVDEAERLNGTHQRSLRTWQIWFLNSHPNAVLVLIA